jgi:hypothetical protein
MQRLVEDRDAIRILAANRTDLALNVGVSATVSVEMP